MIITIPTHGREGRIITQRQFPYARLVDGSLGIAWTRDQIIRDCYPDPVIMFDDDLTFTVRRKDDRTKFSIPTQDDLDGMISEMAASVGGFAYPQVGIACRGGANFVTDRYLENVRCIRAYAFNTKVLVSENIFGFHPDAPYMRDFYVTLSLLTKGYSNLVLNNYAQDHPNSNGQPGGCTGQRTPQLLQRSAEVLQSEFPDFVKIKLKNTKTSWNGEERYDVRIQWKRAAAYGQSQKPAVVDAGTRKHTGS